MTLDVMSNSPFALQANTVKVIWKENLVVHQMSLRAFFDIPLQLVWQIMTTLVLNIIGTQLS